MKEVIDRIRRELQSELLSAASSKDIENIKVKYLGRKGSVQDLMKGLRDLSSDERPLMGKLINDLKEEVTLACDKILENFARKEQEASLANETIDTTLPGRREHLGRQHLLFKVLEKAINILSEMGFSVQTGPHIVSDYYNFESLNFPDDHPARDMQDTFYITDSLLLRTQMTSLQCSIMEKHAPPIRVQMPGKTYRNETVSVRSHVFFHQIDVLYIDEGVTFADLLATKEEFLHRFFSPDIKWRCRPSYFPFVEPGMEIDVSCLSCEGSGCPICKHTGWLEIAGAGMVHPNVLRNGGIDAEKYSGFAWGMGIDRLVMLLHGVSDIRLFTQNDMRFLAQFA